jgi:two-component system, cell cycle response regulator
VDGAESGEQAWAYLQNGTAYALIFLDVVLPGVDGYTLCKTIKKDTQYKHIPVIMLTGKDSPFDRVRGKLARCDMYLTKPVTHEQLQAVIKHHLPQA